jgi:hypothetical protein
MDENVGYINQFHAQSANLVSRHDSLESVLGISGSDACRYAPVRLTKKQGVFVVGRTGRIHDRKDEEYRCIQDFFALLKSAPNIFGPSTRYLQHRPLRFVYNSPQDVRFRQEAVRELSENDELFRAVQSLLVSQKSYFAPHNQSAGEDYGGLGFVVRASPERAVDFLKAVKNLSSLSVRSEALERMVAWASDKETDTLFSELFRHKRKITDSRIFSIYTERYGGVRYGILKPGVKPEDVFDFLSSRISDSQEENYEGTKGMDEEEILTLNLDFDRGRRIIKESRTVVKFKYEKDRELSELAVSHARQRMDHLNAISAQILAVPGLLTLLQLKHLYQGAVLFRHFAGEGPVCFPEIDEDYRTLKVDNLMPIRLLLGGRGRAVVDGDEDEEDEQVSYAPLAGNSFDFGKDDMVIQAEGPNRRGKSEAWRSLHLAHALVNASWPLPAASARFGVIGRSHFIACKSRNNHHGGSELEHNLIPILDGLKRVSNGDTVILDELGDATNGPTAREIGNRLIPALHSRGCRVLVTSHHDALTSFVTQELGGTSLVPDARYSDHRRFSLVEKTGPINFESGEVLDGLNFTPQEIKKVIGSELRSLEYDRDDDLHINTRGVYEDETGDVDADDSDPFDDRPF